MLLVIAETVEILVSANRDVADERLSGLPARYGADITPFL
jgi:hypothetical protein